MNMDEFKMPSILDDRFWGLNLAKNDIKVVRFKAIKKVAVQLKIREIVSDGQSAPNDLPQSLVSYSDL